MSAKDLDQQEAGGETLAAVLEKKDEQIPFELVESEKLENAQTRFTVKVPADEFNKRVDEVLKDYKSQVNIPGFRRGKAPVNLIRTRFGKHANDEAVRKMSGKLAEQVKDKEKLDLVGQAAFDGWEQADDKGAVVKLILEIRPEIEITDKLFKGVSIEVLKREVTDEKVTEEIDGIRANSATFDPAEEGYAFADKDAARLTITGTDPQGKEIPQLAVKDEYSENLQNELPKPVYEALAGKKEGDKFTVDSVELGQDPNKIFANITVKVHEIKKRVLPVLDDEFAKDISSDYESLDDLKKSIREELEEKTKNAERNDSLNAIYRELGKKLEFEIPLSLVHQATERGVMRTNQQLSQYGVSLKQMGQDFIDNVVQRAQAEAEVEVKNMLIGSAVSKFLDLEVTDEMLDEEIKKVADAQGRKPLAIRANLEAQKKLEQFREEIKLRQANDKLISLVDVKKVDKLTEEEDEAPAAEDKAEAEDKKD